MARISLSNVRKCYGRQEAIRNLSLEIEDGTLCVFVGPSGCGKSTLLRTIVGLEELTSGKIEIGDRDVSRLSPGDRGLAMVFQNYALYPHMTVAENIGYPLKLAKVPRDERRRQVEEAAHSLGLAGLLERKPAALSGGQRQRVAIGRAIVRKPEAFLFDEPLSNLDAELRSRMRLEIADLQRRLGATMIYVTHDQVEAMTLADTIVVLRDGVIEQTGPPLELYENPANLFVARFIGSPAMNIFDAEQLSDGQLRLPKFGGLVTRLQNAPASPCNLLVGVRPEHLCIDEASSAKVKVSATEQLGSTTFAYGEPIGDERLCIELRDRPLARPGDEIPIAIRPGCAFLFQRDTGERVF